MERLPTSSLAGSPSCWPRRKQIQGGFAHRCEIAARLVVSAEATEYRYQGRLVAELLAQRPRPSICLPGSHRGVTDRGDESCRKHALQLEFLLRTSGVVRQAFKEVQAVSRLRNRFHHAGAFHRLASGPLPIHDCLLDQAGLGKMVGKQLGTRLRKVGEPLFEHLGDAGVQLLALALEQRLVRHVLHQGMLEGVGGIGRRAAAEDQL